MKNWILNNIFKIAVFLLILGFGIMAADNLRNNPGSSVLAMTVSPIVLLMGYSLIIFAIMRRPFQ
jgi:hypothetical protein